MLKLIKKISKFLNFVETKRFEYMSKFMFGKI